MNRSFGKPRPLRRAISAAGIAFLYLICLGCGDTFRPVAIPIPPKPPDPSTFHFVLVLTDNGTNNPGATSRIDVSGDTNVGVARVGLRPVHATLLPNASRAYIANQSEQTVSWYAPSDVTKVTTITLPDGYSPDFVHTTQNDTVYVAEPNLAAPASPGLVSFVSVTSNVVRQTVAVGNDPVALAETPDSRKLYVVNQGDGTVTSINTIDGSSNGAISTGPAPVWAIARSDSQRVYVLNRDGGTVSTINTVSDSVLGNSSVGVGADFMVYEKTRNRIYVTNSAANTLTVLDATVDPARVVMTISVPASPLSVAALGDGSRVYVASEVEAGGTISPQVTVLNALDGSVRTTITLPISNATCDPATRFRLFSAASADSSRVYVGNCDAGNTAVIRTTPNTSPDNSQSADQLVLEIQAPVSSSPATNGGTPPPQQPVFILASP